MEPLGKTFRWGQGTKDGVAQLQLFKENNLPCPEFTLRLEMAKLWLTQTEVWGRLRNHSKGRDIQPPTKIITSRWGGQQLVRDNPKFELCDYWVKVVPNIQEEWRIQVFDGQSIARGLKVLGEVERPGNRVHKLGLPIRNRLTGWVMRHDIEPPKGLRTLAKQAVEALGYLYGAVDLAITTEGEMVLFEVNSLPGLSEYTASAYATAISEWAMSQP